VLNNFILNEIFIQNNPAWTLSGSLPQNKCK